MKETIECWKYWKKKKTHKNHTLFRAINSQTKTCQILSVRKIFPSKPPCMSVVTLLYCQLRSTQRLNLSLCCTVCSIKTSDCYWSISFVALFVLVCIGVLLYLQWFGSGSIFFCHKQMSMSLTTQFSLQIGVLCQRILYFFHRFPINIFSRQTVQLDC